MLTRYRNCELVRAYNRELKIHLNPPIEKPRIYPTFDVQEYYFAFLSRYKPGYMCYIASRNDLIKGQHTVIKIGKFLKKTNPFLSDDEIRILAAENRAVQTDLKIVTDVHSCFHAYMNNDYIDSCMGHSASHYLSPVHPMQVMFKHPDIGVAYITNANHEVIARALVDTRRKIFPMVYGAWELISQALGRAGYEHRALTGMSFDVNIDPDGDMTLPYIDGLRELDRSAYLAQDFTLNEDKDTITLCDDGEYSADETRGLFRVPDVARCECCDTCTSEDDLNFIEGADVQICTYCLENHYVRVTDSSGGDIYVNENADYVVAEDGNGFVDEDAARANDYGRDYYTNDWYPVDDMHYCSILEDYIISYTHRVILEGGHSYGYANDIEEFIRHLDLEGDELCASMNTGTLRNTIRSLSAEEFKEQVSGCYSANDYFFDYIIMNYEELQA